jgi:mono/diheme cytochrome c family protein
MWWRIRIIGVISRSSLRSRISLIPLLCLASLASAAAGPETATDWSADKAQVLLGKYCNTCHGGKASAGGFNLASIAAADSLTSKQTEWNHLLSRVRNSEMPPKGLPAPTIEDRQAFVLWLETNLRRSACAAGPAPGAWPMRRLNRDEYSATVRDLLNIQVDASHGLPADGAGGEGFDNAAETLFISPIHAEKYLEAAKEALEYGAKDPKSRAVFLIAQPGNGTTPEQAATKILDAFVPRAFRRPARPGETERYMALFRKALLRGDSFDRSILLALNAILISPDFLFRREEPNAAADPVLASDYAMASRLSYFLWGSMPDKELFELAEAGKLHAPATLTAQIERMLKDGKSREFTERFVSQWLGTRELGRDIKPDEKLFPEYYDAEIQAAIRYEPVLFFQEILAKNLSLLNLIDSKFSILTNKLSKFYGFTIKEATQQPKVLNLPEGTHRGGVLNMAAILAVSSYPQRTSPVLRGKWILENMLGTPPPPPPPNVPTLKDNHAGSPALTLRERLEQHRADPTCATCHNRIDPLGFALENYDVLGRWRTEEEGKPIDASGQLPDGTKIAGTDDLKKALLDRKDIIIRNLTSKMLGYALGRGLTLNDSCTVDQIVTQLTQNNYSSQTLIKGIVLSMPFRYQPRARTATITSKKP